MTLSPQARHWLATAPLAIEIAQHRETAWINPSKIPCCDAVAQCSLGLSDVLDAEQRLSRFADYFQAVFPETQKTGGLLESPLEAIPAMQAALEREYNCTIPGSLLIKLDSHLPISGSIKARGGIYEVLTVAEKIAIEHGLLADGDSYRLFATPAFRELFSKYAISVGSTGNLGLSIGIISAKLGFRVTVHMSADARQWKKDLLRSKGVIVKEYASDYSLAVAEGRRQAEMDPLCHFVDDENSKTLFLGYAVAALRLKQQLEHIGRPVDKGHPLFVYLPCGVGGGPGGVAFGLKLVFGDHVHCFFAEPTHACCMMLGMASGLHNTICVGDLGLDTHTAADGLAVGRASGFVGKLMEPFLSGCYTVSDSRMFRFLKQLADTQQIFLEPSALAGMYGPILMGAGSLSAYRETAGISQEALSCSTHLVWATGGSMVPAVEMQAYYNAGMQCISEEKDSLGSTQ